VISSYLQDQLREEKADRGFRVACVAYEQDLRGKVPMYGVFDNNADFDKGELHKRLTFSWRIDDLLAKFPKPPDMIDRALSNLSRLVGHPMHRIRRNVSELQFLLFCAEADLPLMIGYMSEMNLVKCESLNASEAVLTITPRGWSRIAELSRTGPHSRQAFVAMWFDASTEQSYQDGIHPAIEQAGYDPRRMDQIEHNNKICDEIIVEIRRSRFLIADFTGQRGGVYFEAGYAMGMGLPVIWLVHKSDVEKLHFDTRQYNHIVYETPAELYQKLCNRIGATIR